MKLLNRYIVGFLCLILWLSSCQNEQDTERYEALLTTYSNMLGALREQIRDVQNSKEYDTPSAVEPLMEANCFDLSLFYISSLEKTIFEQKKVTHQQWSVLDSLLKQDYKHYTTLGDSLQLIFEQYRDKEAVERCLNQYHEQLAAKQHPLFVQIEMPNFTDDLVAGLNINAVKVRLAYLCVILHQGELNRLEMLLNFVDDVAMSSIEDETPYDWLVPVLRSRHWKEGHYLEVQQDSLLHAGLVIQERYRPQGCEEAFMIVNDKDTLPIDENGYAYFEQLLNEKGEYYFNVESHIKCPQKRFYSFDGYRFGAGGSVSIKVE